MANKNNDKERQFSEDIDRLLAGEEVTGNEDTSEDYRTTINFARKLVELRVDPSPGFKDGLKQQLLLKLTEQEIGATRQKESAFSLWEFLNSLIQVFLFSAANGNLRTLCCGERGYSRNPQI